MAKDQRKTRAPRPWELLLDVPRQTERWVPIPARLKVSVCYLCGNWTIRRGENSVSDERAISGHLRQGSIRWRSFQSVQSRPFCDQCKLVLSSMELTK